MKYNSCMIRKKTIFVMSKKIQMIYKIEAISVLLNEDAILSRYYPLISYKDILIDRLKKNNLLTNYDCFNSDINILLNILGSIELVNLFKRFLIMYEVDESKITKINNLNISEEEKKSYRELFLLPGVKQTRADLYYLSGYKSLKDIASSDVNEITNRMNEAINKYNLNYIVALPKEIKTHIAVSKVYSLYM